MDLNSALQAAIEQGLDLVEVSPTAKPPVCRIMDYGKYKYQQSKRTAEAKKKQVPPVCRIMDYGKYKYQQSKRTAEAKKKQVRVELKEVKMRPKTDIHDYQFKVKNAMRFLGEGNKVKVTIMFRGREVTHPEFGRRLLERVANDVKELGQVESWPNMSGRFMSMVISPLKK